MAEREQQKTTDQRTKTLMLVDDKEVSNFIMKKNISIYLPYCRTLEYTDPDKALNDIGTQQPDLILLDLGLPMVEDGWHFLDQMMDRNLMMKVAIITSSISNEDYEKAMNYPNVIDFISKPIFGEELKAVYDEIDNVEGRKHLQIA